MAHMANPALTALSASARAWCSRDIDGCDRCNGQMLKCAYPVWYRSESSPARTAALSSFTIHATADPFPVTLPTLLCPCTKDVACKARRFCMSTCRGSSAELYYDVCSHGVLRHSELPLAQPAVAWVARTFQAALDGPALAGSTVLVALWLGVVERPQWWIEASGPGLEGLR
ncbi:uncharacterized protein B0T15DRAFT_512800 [Chaetomium strumarium]|uniref:Uncharacterized protein n=1 Tax=Chaetomium strumarium TaxID=1170767 RepID=A0AAJ0GR77_9PEZI|nr:hypothetical protein B0T15DRAFT_512800 [Chaetomium strumarium]